ncbi:hypothetical protein MLD38_033415 [Melastoma candidum]|uniref:Uncharacterized protein n=1 Tax=Melastoma candidum TaxID=119954 RepID=A0ACB9M6N7_9MYRT|nr:hypothetical protein MLD38_033415 [Melastoma candidum]
MLFIREWNNMQYVTSAAFLLMIYSDTLRGTNRELHCPEELSRTMRCWHPRSRRVDYILGSNPRNMSYLVGVRIGLPQDDAPQRCLNCVLQEYKGFIGCTQGYDDWYSSEDANPNVVVGALVGGPDVQDAFVDDRGNYMQTEACTYNTAPLVGVFAKLWHLQNPSFDVLNKEKSALLALYKK